MMNKDNLNKLYFGTREEWRNWLACNFKKEDEVWLIFPKKTSGIKRISYNDAVEEALCFGWIDSNVKSLNEKHFMQRFTPRKKRSVFSQANKERLKWLADKQMIHPEILMEVQTVIDHKFIFPNDIIEAIKRNKTAWENYLSFSESYKRIRIAYIDGARKRPEEFNRRLNNFISKTKNNKLIRGHGGIDKYY